MILSHRKETIFSLKKKGQIYTHTQMGPSFIHLILPVSKCGTPAALAVILKYQETGHFT